MIQIDCINASTVISDDHLKPIYAAIQKQITNDFAPIGAGGRDALLNQILQGQKADPQNFWLTVLDTSDEAGDLGYHDLTPVGQPLSKIFAKSDIDSNSSISVTISHEVLEMLGDPQINRMAMSADGKRCYAFENCDACQDDQFGYKIDGVLVSDFVTDAYFEDPPPQFSLRYDFQKRIAQPFGLLAGGYLGYLDLTNLSQGWQQITARASAPMTGRKPVGSRLERRQVNSCRWVRSTATQE